MTSWVLPAKFGVSSAIRSCDPRQLRGVYAQMQGAVHGRELGDDGGQFWSGEFDLFPVALDLSPRQKSESRAWSMTLTLGHA